MTVEITAIMKISYVSDICIQYSSELKLQYFSVEREQIEKATRLAVVSKQALLLGTSNDYCCFIIEYCQ